MKGPLISRLSMLLVFTLYISTSLSIKSAKLVSSSSSSFPGLNFLLRSLFLELHRIEVALENTFECATDVSSRSLLVKTEKDLSLSAATSIFSYSRKVFQ